MKITNTDANPVLLVTKLQNIKEDKDNLVVAIPPVARVEGGKSQLVRFVLTSKAPLKTERLERVVFTGLPATTGNEPKNKVSMVIGQDLPVLIRPKGLAPNTAPWKVLKWSVQGNDLVARNDSPYVVRMTPRIQLLPQQKPVGLAESYVLPGATVKIPVGSDAANVTGVRLFPVSTFGYDVPSYDAKLSTSTAQSADSQAK